MTLHPELNNLISPERLMNLIQDFGQIGRTSDNGVTRLAFSPEDIQARQKLVNIMASDLGLQVHTDPWGNIIGRREGSDPGAPALLAGSHLDSVRNGGAFDGPAGVFAGCEAVRALNQAGRLTRHPLELVVFCAEEPNDFGMATIGSRGMTGALNGDDLRETMSQHGWDIFRSIAAVGGDPDRLDQGVRDPAGIKAFIELHIEQMPHLEQAGIGIGIVDGVTGIIRHRYTVKGRAAHSGTTPMNQRKDALAAAAELVTAHYRTGCEYEKNAVATVGAISCRPNSTNTVPGEVVLDTEMRSYYSADLKAMCQNMQVAARRVMQSYGVKITSEQTYLSQPTEFSPMIRKTCRKVCRELGYGCMQSISMAGHDAKHMADITDAGMIFIPSRKGISHNPAEWSSPQDLARGSQVLLNTLLELDQT